MQDAKEHQNQCAVLEEEIEDEDVSSTRSCNEEKESVLKEHEQMPNKEKTMSVEQKETCDAEAASTQKLDNLIGSA